MTKYPAWETLENASIRFTFDCTRAEIFPTVIVNAAKTQKRFSHPENISGNAIINTLNNAPNPAAFGAVHRNPVTVVGAP